MEGDVEGYIERGRPRMEYMKQIMIEMGNYSIKEPSYNREAWRTAANYLND